MPTEWIKFLTDCSENIRNARVLRRDNETVWLDVGCKFESVLPLSAWQEDERPPRVGDEVLVVIEDDLAVDDRPLRIARVEVRVTPRSPGWRFAANAKPGNIHTGRIARRIKGGFLVDIGVNAFLPDEQTTATMRTDPEAFIGQVASWRITRVDVNKMEIQVAPA